PGDGREHLVRRSLPVRVPEGRGDAGAGRGQRREAGVGEDPGGGGVPDVGEDQRVARPAAVVQGAQRRRRGGAAAHSSEPSGWRTVTLIRFQLLIATITPSRWASSASVKWAAARS